MPVKDATSPGAFTQESSGPIESPDERQRHETGRPRPGGKDAVCFTAGLKGAAFAAGVIHAWLASDRQAPVVAAGISTGAISSAAMQRCYRELESDNEDLLERKRWAWFRRYLDAVTNNPLSVIWKAIPDPVDFFSDGPPVQDLSAQQLPFKLPAEETKSRRHYYLLTKFGTWLARVPIRIGTLTSILVYRVRRKERYGNRVLNPVLFVWNILKAVAGLWWHVLRSPKFICERQFGTGWYRPLFGWPAWIGSLLAPTPAGLFLVIAWGWLSIRAAILGMAVATAALAAGVLIYLVHTALPNPSRKWSVRTVLFEIGRHFFMALDIERGLLSQFELKRRVAELFGEQTLDPVLCEERGLRMHVLVVCAALQQSKQVWPKESVSVMEALSGACALPGVFPPVRMDRNCLENYQGKAAAADVVDGVAVRANPIPAFFDWCASAAGQSVAKELESEKLPKLHVVYPVPVDQPGSLTEAPPPKSTDIVEAALASLELQKKRDTRQEVRQTNFISGLEKVRRKAAGAGKSRHAAFQIFADEIAPQREIKYRNEWEPSREESLEVAANGCRSAMEVLYRDEIQTAAGGTAVIRCAALLRQIAPGRASSMQGDEPGIPEICVKCCGDLAYRLPPDDSRPPLGAIRSYGKNGKTNWQELPEEFEHLRGVDDHGGKPRIVFLGSGGVFRGAFHIGVIGAMQATGVFPDLVVGASVGALMGGALAAISVSPRDREAELLRQLAGVFLAVDKRVALTRTLKNAAKQLGVRGRDLRIAPAELRRMVLRGSRADAGYAATGAPPALIDAISRLFMFPYRRTSQIASEFIAGHFTKAINRFLQEVRRETLSSFEIEQFLIGTSLLEPEARALLGSAVEEVQLDRVQPYHNPADEKRKVSFFCITSFLNARISLLLGRDFLTEDPTWDFIFAALSSSAFPAVFSPRSESDVLPGRGRTDRLFADGGMFDNLPFFPAIEILGAGQISSPVHQKQTDAVLKRVRRRTASRDVFVAAGLNALPEPESTYDTLFMIYRRAKQLSADSKAKTFVEGAKKVKEALQEIGTMHPKALTDDDADCLDHAVTAAILNIAPTDKDHINPTFAFCRSTGMKVTTVETSIADGCYRALAEFLKISVRDSTTKEAFERTKVPHLAASLDEAFDSGGATDFQKMECPFFYLGAERLRCPFAATGDPSVAAIRSVCAKDQAHRRQSEDLILEPDMRTRGNNK